MSNWNTTFKRPTGALPDTPRSPAPPRAYIEPLSPPGLRPVEPLFNYPAVNSSANHAVRTDQAYNATPKPRSQSLQQGNSRHKRTPSTIDTLAEAAFALSPSFQTHARKGSTASQQNGHSTTYSYGAAYGATEPPHKRSRSDYLPSPLVGPYAASRPATSYGYGHAARPATHYSESRVEEAALLLNIRTGGSTAMSPPARPAQPAVQRPHANSFPRDVYHSRTTNASTHAQTPLLPPFSPHQTQSPRLDSSAHHQSSDSRDRAANVKQATPAQFPKAPTLNPKTITKLEQSGDNSDRPQAPQHVHADENISRGGSTDLAMSETSEASKTRRAGTKGRSKNVTKKSAMEKATSKRAVSRKKTPNPAKAAKKTKADPIDDSQAEASIARRKSMSDAVYGSRNASSTESSRSASVPPENGMLIREASREKPGRKRGDVTSETICSGCFTSRERTASSELDEWISCNGCKKWFHIDCAGFKKAHEVRDVDKFFCNPCEPTHGKTTYVRKSARAHASVDYAELQRGVLKTSEESMEHHYIQPIKDGTLFPFDRESFPRIRPELVTREFFEKSGTFVEPICIPAEWNPRPWEERAGKGKDFDQVAAAGRSPADATADLYPEDFEYDSVRDDGQDKLDMVMPEGLSVRQVCNLVGPEYPLDVIDVKTQNSGAKMNLAKWADYYEEESEDKQIRNVISLEVSQSKLGRLLRRPKVVRDIDLQDQVWPQEETDKGKYPKVQYYCLMSIADSYTDFHIDFGGSSVYYHILKGKKTFFFIPPKPKHLKAYEEWNESPQQNFTFLGNITGECYRVDLKEGDTMLIPSGWIHAVWTPETSLVIGGNFLTRMSYKNQFKVVEIEKANKTPMKFRYPFFQKIMFYTALKYLKDDPLPPSVSQMFYEGKQFHREQPIWQDFDGRIAAKDPRPEAQNSRYYSQAELEGLPDLALYLYHVVLAVLGLRDGISADQMKRMNASIPKGHGEPLEVAKTFALWVAWKTGEPAPAFAHPDALLDTIRDEGPPKKLSARAIKDLERKEAFAAYKVAPDRQSERVMSQKVAAAVATNGVAPSTAPAPPPPERPPSNHHQQPSFAHQPYHQPSPSLPPSALMMAGSPGQYISTPKTSVLGPKRVACDACRKRRIKCKHKDMVVQASPNGFHQVNGIAQDGSFQSNLAPELHDNITVSSPKPASDGTNGHLNGAPQANGFPPQSANGNAYMSSHGPLPGTNAYINANIPMTMNGVPIFGEASKRGRTKACYECRKSKRRCVHDENGNVDPVKAAETPVPRGSTGAKKRPGEEDSPLQAKKIKSADDSQALPRPQAGTAGVLMPHPTSRASAPRQSSTPSQERPPPPVINEPPPEPQQPEIDPNLFSAYPDPASQAQYTTQSYPYPVMEHSQAQNYDYPSLEQIANEVLDMNGRVHEDYIDAQLNALPFQRLANGTAAIPNYHSKPDGSVDSAVSLPNSDSFENSKVTGDRTVDDRLRDALAGQTSAEIGNGLPAVAPSVETNGASQHSPVVEGLPLYRPPAPLSQSPEQSRRQPATAKIELGEIASQKRNSQAPSASPNAKRAVPANGDVHEPSAQETEDERLAREMHSDDLGLRRRPSRQ